MMLWVFLIVLQLTAAAVVQSYTGTVNGNITSQQLSYQIPSGNDILSVYFKVTNIDFSNTIVFVSFSPISLSLDAQRVATLIASSDYNLYYMDILSVIGGYPQFVNMYIPNSANTLYLALYNLDLPEVSINKNYNLVLQFSNNLKLCYECPIYAELLGGLTCKCSPCPANTFGDSCQYNISPLSDMLTLTIPAGKNKYYQLGSRGSDFQLTLQEGTNTSAVTLYMQYNYAAKVMAGKLNCLYKNGQPTKLQVTSTLTTITIPANPLGLLLTFRNTASSQATITISVLSSSQTQTSYLPIILGVVFGVLGSILIIYLICKGKKYFVSRNVSVLNVSPAAMVDPNSLLDDEINKYFPAVDATVLLPAAPDQSETIINAEVIAECSICFDDVTLSEQVRVTYCRHVFHAKCLLFWFHKNQICPNCRQSFDFQTTKRMRKALPKNAKATPKALVRAILGDSLPQLQQRRPKHFQKQDLEKDKPEREGQNKMDEEATENRIG